MNLIQSAVSHASSVQASLPSRKRAHADGGSWWHGLALAFWLLCALEVLAAPAAPAPMPSPETQLKSVALRKGMEMDYGPFISYTIDAGSAQWGTTNLVLKGVAIRLGGAAAICFDTELLRYASGWTGSFLDITDTHLASYKGSKETRIAGELKFETPAAPGLSAISQPIADPRPLRSGPLPQTIGRYDGLYRSGSNVVLQYRVGGTVIRDQPAFAAVPGAIAFLRTIEAGPATEAQRILLCRWSADAGEAYPARTAADVPMVIGALAAGNEAGLAVAGVGLPPGAKFVAREGTMTLELPARAAAVSFTVAVIRGGPAPASLRESALTIVRGSSARTNLAALTRSGPALWPQTVLTRGKLGRATDAYAVDTMTAPETNPWKSWLRFVAFDFFSDGSAAVSTWNGDVWLVTGIDDKLERLEWKRFAAGLYEPLGLRIVRDEVYVRCRDQITRLRDLNGDREADFYENFNNEGYLAANYHAFVFDLQTDSAGNFYYSRTGHRADPELPLNGTILRVTPDGSRTELVARGFRVPNGLSLGPRDEITSSDNQGDWVPSSRINWIRPGGFYGFVPQAGSPQPPSDYEKPICWLPVTLDNSSGGQVWVTSDRWGPFTGHLLHTSYGRCALFHVMHEFVDGVVQGGVFQFPLQFESGIMRGRFNARDGQLYLCGLRGWQTSAVRDAAFHRVRYTGVPATLPLELHVRRDGIEITFTAPLNGESAADTENYAVEQWNYLWSNKYGSPEYSVAEPQRIGRDTLPLAGVTVSADNRTVLLRLGPVQPVMQMRIQFRLRDAAGKTAAGEIYNTINRVPR